MSHFACGVVSFFWFSLKFFPLISIHNTTPSEMRDVNNLIIHKTSGLKFHARICRNRFVHQFNATNQPTNIIQNLDKTWWSNYISASCVSSKKWKRRENGIGVDGVVRVIVKNQVNKWEPSHHQPKQLKRFFTAH